MYSSTSKYYIYNSNTSTLKLKINRRDVINYYLKKVDEWITDSNNKKIPHIFILIEDIIKRLCIDINSFEYKQDFGWDHTWLIGLEYKERGWRLGLTWLLDYPENPYRNLNFRFSTRDIGKLNLITEGDFFMPLISNWNKPVIEYKFTQLKTKQNHEIYISNFHILIDNNQIYKNALNLRNKCKCPTISLVPRSSSYSSFLQYICLCCGKAYICECFKNTEKYWSEYLNKAYDLDKSDDGDPVIKYVSNHWIYRKNICHVCRGILPDIEFTSSMYCSNFMSRYSPWVYSLAQEDIGLKRIELNSELMRKYENKFRGKIGVPLIGEGWISETQLYKSILSYYGNKFKVIHHARPKYLTGQEYDIYIPEIKLAIEYDGRQHYEPIEYFGGEEGFQKIKKRDVAKDKKAKENGDTILRVRENYKFDRIIENIESYIKKLQKKCI